MDSCAQATLAYRLPMVRLTVLQRNRFRDVSGSIGGRSGDFTYVGRVARVWVETKWD